MGTADKLCCAILALQQYIERHNVDYRDASFIFLEVGFGFTAAIGIENGKIIDAVGGTSGFWGFLSPGSIDSELAIRMDKQLQDVLFTGGANSWNEKIKLDELKSDYNVWNTLIEGAVKDVAVVKTTTPAQEIIISGRLSRIPEVKEELCEKLKPYGKVVSLQKKAKNASEAAEGAVIIGVGLLGGKYKELIETIELKGASGTMYDYITMKVEYEK
jgi:predicted butyrate kinase (DUF1464 family)